MASRDTGQSLPSKEIPQTQEAASPVDSDSSSDDHADKAANFEPIHVQPGRPRLESTSSSRRQMTDDDLIQTLSRTKSGIISRQGTRSSDADHKEDLAQIERLMTRMFGRERQANSEEEKTRHKGVVFKQLSVKGLGLGAALQPTVGDIFAGLPRLLRGLITRGPKASTNKPPIRTILDDFSGCVRPGEMLLVLGRPGSGCSTFLKVIGNQRFGFESVDGVVTYGGTDAATMAKRYRGEGKLFLLLPLQTS